MADSILGSIQDSIRKDMNELADDLATGTVVSLDDPGKVALVYANKTGVVEGLARAERAILDVLEEIEKRESEDK